MNTHSNGCSGAARRRQIRGNLQPVGSDVDVARPTGDQAGMVGEGPQPVAGDAGAVQQGHHRGARGDLQLGERE